MNGGTWSVNRKITQSSTGGLSLSLRAVIWANGGAWSVTMYLTSGKIMQLMADAPSLLRGYNYKPQTESGHVRHFDPRSVGFVIFSKSYLPLVKTPSTRSWCHIECEIKALVILSVYDDVL